MAIQRNKHLLTFCLVEICTSIQILDFSTDLDRSNLGNIRLQGLVQDALNGDPTGIKFD